MKKPTHLRRVCRTGRRARDGPGDPPDATPEEIESIVLAEGAAAMTDEQDRALQERLNAGVRRGKAR